MPAEWVRAAEEIGFFLYQGIEPQGGCVLCPHGDTLVPASCICSLFPGRQELKDAGPKPSSKCTDYTWVSSLGCS